MSKNEDIALFYEGTWLEEFYDLQYTDYQIYTTSFYWTITTITTVGYGDIYGVMPQEKIFCMLIMVIGVISFSFVSGSMSSIMTWIDQKNAQSKSSVGLLDKIYQQHRNIPKQLIIECKKYIQSNNEASNDYEEEIGPFLEEFPDNLKSQLILFIHQDKYDKILFFKDRTKQFISWICPLLKPATFPEDQHIILEKDDITHINFLIKGEAGYALPNYDNAVYIKVDEGDHFGVADIVGSFSNHEVGFKDDWISRKAHLQCQFTVIAITKATVLSFEVDSFHRMQIEHPDLYEELIVESMTQLRNILLHRFKAMKECRLQQKLFLMKLSQVLKSAKEKDSAYRDDGSQRSSRKDYSLKNL